MTWDYDMHKSSNGREYVSFRRMERQRPVSEAGVFSLLYPYGGAHEPFDLIIYLQSKDPSAYSSGTASFQVCIWFSTIIAALSCDIYWGQASIVSWKRTDAENKLKNASYVSQAFETTRIRLLVGPFFPTTWQTAQSSWRIGYEMLKQLYQEGFFQMISSQALWMHDRKCSEDSNRCS